jgi:hypothetical protein
MMEGVRKCRLASLSHQHLTTKCKGTWTTCYLARLYQSYTELNSRPSRDRVSDFKRQHAYKTTAALVQLLERGGERSIELPVSFLVYNSSTHQPEHAAQRTRPLPRSSRCQGLGGLAGWVVGERQEECTHTDLTDELQHLPAGVLDGSVLSQRRGCCNSYLVDPNRYVNV